MSTTDSQVSASGSAAIQAAVQAVAAQRRSSRVRLAQIVACGVVVIAVVSVIALQLGAAGLSFERVVLALVGAGDDADWFVVWRLRLPRIVAAVVVGAAFALAGAVFQSVLRNPLASPDILGISGGASLGAVFAILVLGLGGLAVSGVALGGALVVASAIWALAWKQGMHGIRFILIGVGLSYLCSSVLAWLLARGEVREAQSVLIWTVGSVADIRGDQLITLTILVAAFAALVGGLAPALRALALGDEHARGLGVNPAPTKFLLLVAAVGLVAVATSSAGPVAFVALVAPAIARRLQGDGSASLGASAVVGAALTLTADTVGQHAIAGFTAPVGVVTGLIGAPYLLWLLATHERRNRA